MRTILITIPSAPLSQGFLRTNFLDTLLEGGDTRAVLLVPQYREDYYKEEFGTSPNIVIEAAPEPPYKRFEDRVDRFLRQSIPTRTIYNRQMHGLVSSTGTLRWARFCGVRILWMLGHLRAWRTFLRFLYGFSPYRAYLPLIDRLQPNLIFVTTLMDPMDLGLMKAARRRGTVVVGMPKSWDNLTSKCFMIAHPDHLLVQNSITKNEAVRYADFPESQITVCGVPQFDFYFQNDQIVPRDTFLEKIGLSSEDRYVLFAGEGTDIFVDECEVLEMISDLCSSDSALGGRKIAYRPHPNYRYCVQTLADRKNIVLAAAQKVLKNTGGGWEFEPADIRYLLSLLQHADAIMLVASTLAIEAALLDKPVIGIAFDGKINKPFFRSIRRYYHTTHFDNIVQTSGIRLAENISGLENILRTYIEHPSTDAGGRKRIVSEQVGFTDGKSAERIARALVQLL